MDDRRERRSRIPDRKPSRAKSLMRIPARTPLLLRTTITVGLIAAIAVSMARAGDGGMARNMIAGLQGNAVVNAGAHIAGVMPARNAGGSAVTQAQSTMAKQPPAKAARSAAPAAVQIVTAGAAAPAGGQPSAQAGTQAGAPAQAPCHVTYKVTQTAKQFTAVMVIVNTSAVKVKGWTLRWAFPADQKIIYGWNSVVTNGPAGAAATDAGLNRVIAPGASTTIGFSGTTQNWVPTPSGFSLNGAMCS